MADNSPPRQKLIGKDFGFWRDKIGEALGVYVFRFSLPEDELDGFSYIEDGIPYGITVNSKGRIVANFSPYFMNWGTFSTVTPVSASPTPPLLPHRATLKAAATIRLRIFNAGGLDGKS